MVAKGAKGNKLTRALTKNVIATTKIQHNEHTPSNQIQIITERKNSHDISVLGSHKSCVVSCSTFFIYFFNDLFSVDD